MSPNVAIPASDHVTEMDLRLRKVEERLHILLSWQSAIAAATIGKLSPPSTHFDLKELVTPPVTPSATQDRPQPEIPNKELPSSDFLSLQPPADIATSTLLGAQETTNINLSAPTLSNTEARSLEAKEPEKPKNNTRDHIITGTKTQEKAKSQPTVTVVAIAEESEDVGSDTNESTCSASKSVVTLVTVANEPEVVEYPINNDPSTRLADRILDVMATYSQHLITSLTDGHAGHAWPGKFKFIERVKRQVDNNEPVKIILPAFPWKSINTVDKVDGRLPDLGEVLALSRLNAMCEDIKKIYSTGAELTIATDGLVFDDIVGITDEDTWAYSESLLAIVAEKRFNSIKLARVFDLQATTQIHMDKETYMSQVSNCRAELLREYGRTEDEIRELIQSDSDSLLTYRGFIRFLEKDLKHSHIGKTAVSGAEYRRRVKRVATNMMIRAESFTKLIAAKRPDHVRLSIHPSTGMAKLSVPLVITGDGQFPRTPWHCVLAVGVDGSYSTIHSRDVRETHVLIHHNGQPYYWREKSPLWDSFDQAKIMFEPQYPKTLLIYPKDSSSEMSLNDEQIENLHRLAETYGGPVVLSGFSNDMATLPGFDCDNFQQIRDTGTTESNIDEISQRHSGYREGTTTASDGPERMEDPVLAEPAVGVSVVNTDTESGLTTSVVTTEGNTVMIIAEDSCKVHSYVGGTVY
ncbi:hypothetical protein K431DRAFT_310319 [Polychaeton citri CBS 116435]|uniref:Pyoverdine/dityrosine biosynthesis protein n=1 Tax=Polychaeton citri CBS 116435 TaxID=1314669 RepID=A0A9P4QBX8_9PEZI|nr:hypothetical protein K431DRAFT_310319 [Polychaeton citri CBS 116435]